MNLRKLLIKLASFNLKSKIAALMASASLIIGGMTSGNVDIEKPKEDVSTETEINYFDYVEGIPDYLETNVGEEPNLVKGITWDDEYVARVKIISNINYYTTPGVYKVSYLVIAVDGSEHTEERPLYVRGGNSGEVDPEDDKVDAIPTPTITPKPTEPEEKPEVKPTVTPTPEVEKPDEKPEVTPNPTVTPTPEVEKPGEKPEEKPEVTPNPTVTPTPTITPKPTEPVEKPEVTPIPSNNRVYVFKEVEHPAVTETQIKVIKEAWTEEVPVYETKCLTICKGCGGDFTGCHATHAKEQMLLGNYDCGRCYTDYREVQVGTKMVNHPEITEEVEVVVKEAWVEKVVVGQKCSSCGELK